MLVFPTPCFSVDLSPLICLLSSFRTPNFRRPINNPPDIQEIDCGILAICSHDELRFFRYDCGITLVEILPLRRRHHMASGECILSSFCLSTLCWELSTTPALTCKNHRFRLDFLFSPWLGGDSTAFRLRLDFAMSSSLGRVSTAFLLCRGVVLACSSCPASVENF